MEREFDRPNKKNEAAKMINIIVRVHLNVHRRRNIVYFEQLDQYFQKNKIYRRK